MATQKKSILLLTDNLTSGEKIQKKNRKSSVKVVEKYTQVNCKRDKCKMNKNIFKANN